jgi:hypothetical protein
MKLSGSGNAHGALWNQGTYTQYLCCDFPGTHTCDGSNKVLGLSSLDNAHGEASESSTYTNDVCFEQMECRSTIGAREAGEIDLVSLSSTTNAHIGAIEDYDTKIYCKPQECIDSGDGQVTYGDETYQDSCYSSEDGIVESCEWGRSCFLYRPLCSTESGSIFTYSRCLDGCEAGACLREAELVDYGVSPEISGIGTIFSIKMEVNDNAYLSTIKATIRKKSNFFTELLNPEIVGVIFLFDDGNQGDGEAGDKVYGGVWDSLGQEEGDYVVDIEIDFSGNVVEFNDLMHFVISTDDCIEILQNGDSITKADIVFIGDGYFRESELQEDILNIVDYDGNNGYNGLFSVEPFKLDKNKFNFWMILDQGIISNGINNHPLRQDALSLASNYCPHAEYKIILSKESFRSYCYYSGDCYLSLPSGIRHNSGSLILHEFGHGFAQLTDEYIEPSKGRRNEPYNCVYDEAKAQERWGDLVYMGNKLYSFITFNEVNGGYPKCSCDQSDFLAGCFASNIEASEEVGTICFDAYNNPGEEIKFFYFEVLHDGVDYFEGCGYVKENFRPTSNSIMKSLSTVYFGPYNERRIQEVLDIYS